MTTVKIGRLTASYSEGPSQPINGLLLALPEYTQEDYHSCGFCAALTVARYFDADASDEVLLASTQTMPGWGTSQKGIITGLAVLSVVARYRDDLEVRDLRTYVSLGVPVIISVWPDGWSVDHWTVVRGFSKSRVYLTNHYTLTLRGFEREWIENWEEGEYGAGLVCTKER